MSRRTQKNVGVIGLGIIGRRVADCLRARGFPTFVWNRTPRPFPNFVGSPAEIADLCDFIQIFVSDDDALLQVVQQMKQSFNSHHVVLAHCTVTPATMRAAAEIVQRRGAQLLDAPFTGSKMAAEKGELVYYIGGDDAAYRRARPVLEASSKQIVEIGEIGQATTIKLATNMITAATVQVAAEALALVHNSGLPLEKFAEAMASNGSNSGTLTMKLPKMIGGDFDPHFSVKHMLKDVEIAARLARAYGVTLPVTEIARDNLVEETKRGRGEVDYSSMVHSFFPDGPPNRSTAAGVLLEEEQPDLDLSAPEVVEPPVEEPVEMKEEPVEAKEEIIESQTNESMPEAVLVASETVEDKPVMEMEMVEEPKEVATAKTVEVEAEASDENDDEEEEPPRRGFLSRIFSKVDY